MIYFVIAAISILAGIVQGVTGFGAGIVMMMIFPLHFGLLQSAGISGAIGFFLCASMIFKYRKNILFREAILPALLCIFVCSLTINFATSIDQVILKKFFGIFLLILSAYYLFFKKSADNKKLSLPLSIIFIIISAICDGLFGIGGPLMVIYFLNKTESIFEYLATLQLYFLICSIYNTAFRFYVGILSAEHLNYIFCGAIGIFVGVLFAGKIVDKLNPEIIRKLTYMMIGFCGIFNLL